MNSRTSRQTWIPVLAIALAIGLSACQDLIPTPRGEIEGAVVNRMAGTSIEGTTVRLVELPETATTTAPDGTFLLEAPIGTWTLEFAQDGFATSRVEGVRVLEDERIRQDVIQAEAFDPAAPVVAPTIGLSLADGDVVAVDPATDLFEFDIDVAVADPSLVQPYFITAGLGQSRGTSGYLNEFVPGDVVGLGQASVTAELSAEGFDGETTLHVVAYDTNFNRTERIVRVDVESVVIGAAPIAPTDLVGNAVTFGDVGVFGGLGVPPQVTGAQLVSALEGQGIKALAPTPSALPIAFDEVQPAAGIGTQDYLDEVVTWVDLYFAYAFASPDDLPTAFEVHRRIGPGDFELLGRVSPFQAYLSGSTFGFRDATPSLRAGVEVTYRVDAVTGGDRESSEPFATTPLGAFEVTADTPVNGADFTSVLPTYEMSYTGTADEVYIGVLVFDRVHAEDNFVEWGVDGLSTADDGILPGISVTTTGASIPHNVDGSASTSTLQPFHAYDWTPVAVTYTSDFSAISIAADFFDLFGLGFGVSDGPWNTFLTGDGSF